MHKPAPFYRSFEKEEEDAITRFLPQTSSSSYPFPTQTKGEGREQAEGPSSFSNRGHSTAKLRNRSAEYDCSSIGQRKLVGGGKKDAMRKDGFSLLPPSKNVPHIIMDPLAVLRQCIRYFACHPEVYGTNLRCVLDREIMHVMRLQASESSIALQQPVLSSDDVFTAVEIMQNRILPSTDTSTEVYRTTSTSPMLPPLHLTPSKGRGVASLSEGGTGEVPSNTTNACSASSFSTSRPCGVRKAGHEKEKERGNRPLLGYGSLLFMPMRYDFEALTQKLAPQSGFLPHGGGDEERTLSVSAVSTVSQQIHESILSPHPGESSFFSRPTTACAPWEGIASSSTPKASGKPILGDASNPLSPISGTFNAFGGSTSQEEKELPPGRTKPGEVQEDACKRDGNPRIGMENGAPRMIQQGSKGEGNDDPESTDPYRSRERSVSPSTFPSFPSSAGGTTSCFVPNPRGRSLWPMENAFVESLKQLMEQQFQNRHDPLEYLPPLPSSSSSSSASASSASPACAFGSPPSVMLVDANGYEVSYIRRQLQQMEAAYNAKCIRLHELVEENARLHGQLKDSEEKSERWLKQYRDCHEQVEALRREVEGWRVKAEGVHESGEGEAVRKGRKGASRAFPASPSPTMRNTTRSLALSKRDGRENELERITKLWRENEKSLQEVRRALENTEKEANSTHDHLTDAFHYIERLERRVARRNQFLCTTSRRQRSLEEKYEKLMWCFREQSTIIGAHSYADHAMADDPYWTLFTFYHLHQHVGDTYPMEETLLLGSSALSLPTSTGKAPPGAGGGSSGRKFSNAVSSTHPALLSVPNVQFGRSDGGGRLVDENFSTTLIYSLMADEATGVTERRGRLKRLRTNLVGAVGCKVLRWENLFVIDYLGGEENRPNATPLSRTRLPLLTLASLTQPLRDAFGARLDTTAAPPPSNKKSREVAGRPNTKRRSLSEAPTETIPEDTGPPNTLLYDQATVRLLLRNFWHERVEQYSMTYYHRVQESKRKTTRSHADGPTASWEEGAVPMTIGERQSEEEEEAPWNDAFDAETCPNTFLAGLMVYVFRLCGAKTSGVAEGEDTGNGVKEKGSATDKEVAETIRSGSAKKADPAASTKSSEISARSTSRTGGEVENEEGKGHLPSIFLAVRGVVSRDPGLWDDGCLFFACVANAKIRTSLPPRDATSPPHVPEFTMAMREMICAMYYYTMEYKEMDPDFRLFYLVSHQLIPEMVGINFYCGIEAMQRDCEALLKENVDPNADGKVLEKIKKDAFPHTVAGGDGNFLLLGGNEFLISAPSRTGDSRENSAHRNLLLNKPEGNADTSGVLPASSVRSNLGSVYSNGGSLGGSVVTTTTSQPGAKGISISPPQAFQYFLFSPVEAISKAAELIDRTPIIAETARLEEDSEEDGYGSVLPGVIDHSSSPTPPHQSSRNNSTCLLVKTEVPLSGAIPKDTLPASMGNGKRLSSEGNDPAVSSILPSSAVIGVASKGEGSRNDGFHSPTVSGGGNGGAGVVAVTSHPEEEILDEGAPHEIGMEGGRGRSSLTSMNGGPPQLNESMKSTHGRNVPSSALKGMNMSTPDGELSKLRHDLLDYLDTLQYRRSSHQIDEYEKRKERMVAERQRRLAQVEDPRETWQQLDNEVRRIFGTHSEIMKDFTSLEISDGVGGPKMGGGNAVEGTGRGSTAGMAKGKSTADGGTLPSPFPVASHRTASSLFLSHRRQRLVFDSRIRKSLAATRGLIPQEDFLLLFHKHFFATYAITTCGTPRFPISCATFGSSNGAGEEYYAPYDRVGFIPPLPIHLQRLRMALSLDQPTTLVNYRQLFSTDVGTFSPSHFYAEFLTLSLDVFLQQQNFLMSAVLSSCNSRHSRYFEMGAEECDGLVPISSLKSGFTQSLAMIDATSQQAAALVEHLQEYDNLLRADELLRVEQFTDLPLLFAQPVPFGEGNEEAFSSVDVLDGASTEAPQGEGSGEEYTSSTMQVGGSTTELWHFEDEAANSSLLHLSLAIRMLYPIWGTGCLKQAKRLSELLQSWTPVTKIDPNISVVPPIIQVNAPSTPFEKDMQNRYLISAQHLAQGDSGFLNPLRVTAKWIVEEARVKAFLTAKESATVPKETPPPKNGFSGSNSSKHFGASERSVDIGEELLHYDFDVPPEKQLEGGGMVPNWRYLRLAFAPFQNASPSAPSKEASKSTPRKGERKRRKSKEGRRRRSSSGSRSSSLRRNLSAPEESAKKASTKILEIEKATKDSQPSAAFASSAPFSESRKGTEKGLHSSSNETGTAVGFSELALSAATAADKRVGVLPPTPPPTRDFGLYILSRAMGMSRSYAIQGPPSKKKKKGPAGKKGSSNLPFGVELQLKLQRLHSENTRDMFGASQSLLYDLLAPLKDVSFGISYDYSSSVSSAVPRPVQPTPSFPLPVKKSSAEGLGSERGDSSARRNGKSGDVENDSDYMATGSAFRISVKGSPMRSPREKAGRRGERKSPGTSDTFGNFLLCPPWAPGFRNVPPKRRRSTAMMLSGIPVEAKALPSDGATGNGSLPESENKVILYVEDLRSAMAAMSLIS